jgi:hydrogenase maturation factor
MCLSAVGTVVGVEPGAALVEMNGTVRRARLLIEPAVALGDTVLVGLGTVLALVDPADEAALRSIYAQAAPRGALDPATPTHQGDAR